jgi:hypothetical protein
MKSAKIATIAPEFPSEGACPGSIKKTRAGSA